MVTHDQAEALAIADRVVVMNAGGIEQIGTPAEIYRRPASRFVAEFVGAANWLPARRRTRTAPPSAIACCGWTRGCRTARR